MSKPQGVLKMFMLGVLKNHIENRVEVQKKTPSHFTARVEIERQISFFSFGFARVTEVRHICNLNFKYILFYTCKNILTCIKIIAIIFAY